ncbi:hypothetical protein POPTR_018G144501v4 [Populus trichocarpa]|uniref:Uncharacterized protein n=1 Tax=Populus trichocarpa TaxID=3694 RepID=A0ACC0RPI5_POPTR|nr:hypothetical protein POPTR_018G144501v4 [Populus trichocarpa]
MVLNPCLLLLFQLLLRIEAAKRGKEKERLTWSCYLKTKTMVMEGWLTNVTFFPSTSVFRSLHLCSCFSLLVFSLFFFFFFAFSCSLCLSLFLFLLVSLCIICVCSFRLCFFFFCIICLWFSPFSWPFSIRPGFSGFVFGWLDQQPTVRGS